MLQCLYRTRTSRKYFQELKRQALKRKATLLQKYVRGFVVRQWVGRLHRRVKSVHKDILAVGLYCFCVHFFRRVRALPFFLDLYTSSAQI